MKTLTPEDVLDIFERCQAGERQGRIASDYDVSNATVSGIKHGLYWNKVTGLPRYRGKPLTARQERMVAIYNAYWQDKRAVREIADEYGLTPASVYAIRDGRTGAHITGHPIKQRNP